MVWRVVLTAVAISYLICVLWLSGLQKEDMDVNMLRKLQRHNVNIDDMANADIQKYCLKNKTRKDSRVEESNFTAILDEVTAQTDVLFDNTSTTAEAYRPKNVPMILENLIKKLKENDTEVVYKKSNDTEILNRDLGSLEPNTSEEITALYPNITDSKNTDKDISYEQQPNLNDIMKFWKRFATPYMENKDDLTTEKFIPKTTRSYNKHMTQSKKANAEKNVMDFWKMFDVLNTSDKPKLNMYKSVPAKKQISSREQESHNKLKDLKFMSKLLADYFYEHVKQETTTEITTTTTIDLSKVSENIEKVLKLLSNRKNNADIKNNDNRFTDKDLLQFNNQNLFPINKPQHTVILRNDQYVESDSKKHSMWDISDMLLFNDQLKKSSAIDNQTDALHPVSNILYHQRTNKHFYQVPVWTTTIIPAVRYDVVKSDTRSLPKDMMEEIVKNVKDIILKDLKNDITTSTTPYISTLQTNHTQTYLTTTDIITSSSSMTNFTSTEAVTAATNNHTQETYQVLKTLVDVLKDFKNMTSRIMSASTKIPPKPTVLGNPYLPLIVQNKNKIDTLDVIKKQHSVNLMTTETNKTNDSKKVLTKLMELFEEYKALKENTASRVREAPLKREDNNFNIFQKPLLVQNKVPDEIINTVHQQPKITQNILKTYSSNYYKEQTVGANHVKVKGSAIIQTNLDEIPPLTINVANPSKLIHQNIVVTTAVAQVSKKPLDPWVIRHHTDKSQKGVVNNEEPWLFGHNAVKNHNNLNKNERESTKHSNQYTDTRNRHDYEMIPKKYSSNRFLDKVRSNYKPISHQNIKSKVGNDRDIRNKYDDNITVTLVRNHNTERFYERMEKDDSSVQRNSDKKCCGEFSPPVSRQQVSLNNMKPRFDDTHFKNFLKTQQKVNDMLERILATKTFPNSGLRSVETT